MTKNNLKRYLMSTNEISIEPDESTFSFTAEWRDFCGKCIGDANDFSSASGRTLVMNGAIDLLIECILEAEKIINDLNHKIEIDSLCQEQDKILRVLH